MSQWDTLMASKLCERRSLKGQCLDRRIDSKDFLVSEIAAWERRRNDSGQRIKWMFTTEQARHKMARAYPTPTATASSDASKESQSL